jgi:hypothetical protein
MKSADWRRKKMPIMRRVQISSEEENESATKDMGQISYFINNNEEFVEEFYAQQENMSMRKKGSVSTDWIRYFVDKTNEALDKDDQEKAKQYLQDIVALSKDIDRISPLLPTLRYCKLEINIEDSYFYLAENLLNISRSNIERLLDAIVQACLTYHVGESYSSKCKIIDPEISVSIPNNNFHLTISALAEVPYICMAINHSKEFGNTMSWHITKEYFKSFVLPTARKILES